MRRSGVVSQVGDVPGEAEDYGNPRRPWILIILSPILAALALWAGVEWRNALEREGRLRAELKQVYLEAEALRLEAAQARERGALLEQQVGELTREKEEITRRVSEAEAQLKASRGRPRPTRPAPSAR